LRRLVRARGAAEVAGLLPGQTAGELGVLLPDFGTPPAGADPGTARARLFEVLLTLLETLAEQQPVVLVVEDVHWADRSTCDLLSFLVRNLRQARVLLVGTFRSDEMNRNDLLRPLLAGLARAEGGITPAAGPAVPRPGRGAARGHPGAAAGRRADRRGVPARETAERMLDELRSLPAGVQAESQRLLSLARIEIDARLAWAALAQPQQEAYALLLAARAASAAGNREGAAARLGRAADLAGRLGARPLLEQIGSLARRARVDVPALPGPRGHVEPGGAAPFGLTERELEVLRLVAAGRGNRDIAAELVISPKTASVHVSNILGKLGVSSRGEAAAMAYQQHLLDDS
jgi:DNA-binding NarL/FixJ family response regulator